MDTLRLLILGLVMSMCGCSAVMPELLTIGADAKQGDSQTVAIWIYDAEVAAGGTIDAKVRVVGGLRAAIGRVTITGAGPVQLRNGPGSSWGTEVTSTAFDRGDSSFEFPIAIPDDATKLHLEIEVETLVARQNGASTFSNGAQIETFKRDVTVRSPGTTTVRRVVRGGLAVGACLAVIMVLVYARRRNARLGREPSEAWLLMIIPYGIAEHFVFSSQLAAALGLHGIWFSGACLAGWLAILAIPRALAAKSGFRRYVVTRPMIEIAATDDRSAPVSHATTPVMSVEGAWMAAGLIVARKRGHIHVGPRGLPGVAIVTLPSSEMFGPDPIEIRSRDRHTVITMLDAAAATLGDLQCHIDGEADVLHFTAPRAAAQRPPVNIVASS